MIHNKICIKIRKDFMSIAETLLKGEKSAKTFRFPTNNLSSDISDNSVRSSSKNPA